MCSSWMYKILFLRILDDILQLVCGQSLYVTTSTKYKYKKISLIHVVLENVCSWEGICCISTLDYVSCRFVWLRSTSLLFRWLQFFTLYPFKPSKSILLGGSDSKFYYIDLIDCRYSRTFISSWQMMNKFEYYFKDALNYDEKFKPDSINWNWI